MQNIYFGSINPNINKLVCTSNCTNSKLPTYFMYNNNEIIEYRLSVKIKHTLYQIQSAKKTPKQNSFTDIYIANTLESAIELDQFHTYISLEDTTDFIVKCLKLKVFV
jgi:hypothetical protein